MKIIIPNNNIISNKKVIVHDTRDKVGKHKNVDEVLEQYGYKVIRSKLYVGDVTLLHNQSVCIDLKASVMELIQNVYRDHDRFRRECVRARECGIQLIVLTEEELPEGGLECWKVPHFPDGKPMTQANPIVLRKTLITMQKKYGVQFRFCRPKDTGQLIIRILTKEAKDD